jgi:hypothetical protein
MRIVGVEVIYVSKDIFADDDVWIGVDFAFDEIKDILGAAIPVR